jgi:putative phosphoribosyl transferase
VCLAMPERFNAVGMWYSEFRQTSDEEMRRLLANWFEINLMSSSTGYLVATDKDDTPCPRTR